MHDAGRALVGDRERRPCPCAPRVAVDRDLVLGEARVVGTDVAGVVDVDAPVRRRVVTDARSEIGGRLRGEASLCGAQVVDQRLELGRRLLERLHDVGELSQCAASSTTAARGGSPKVQTRSTLTTTSPRLRPRARGRRRDRPCPTGCAAARRPPSPTPAARSAPGAAPAAESTVASSSTAPGRRSTAATGTAPRRSSLTPTTAASATRGIAFERGAHVVGLHLVPAADDGLVGAPDDPDEAVGVDPGEVGGAHPLVGAELRGPGPRATRRRRHRDRCRLGVDDPQRAPGVRAADAAPLGRAELLVVGEVPPRDPAAELGGAVRR